VKLLSLIVLFATVDVIVGLTTIICPVFKEVILGIDTSFYAVAAAVVDVP
jgi:hypothetical protein